VPVAQVPTYLAHGVGRQDEDIHISNRSFREFDFIRALFAPIPFHLAALSRGRIATPGI